MTFLSFLYLASFSFYFPFLLSLPLPLLVTLKMNLLTGYSTSISGADYGIEGPLATFLIGPPSNPRFNPCGVPLFLPFQTPSPIKESRMLNIFLLLERNKKFIIMCPVIVSIVIAFKILLRALGCSPDSPPLNPPLINMIYHKHYTHCTCHTIQAIERGRGC